MAVRAVGRETRTHPHAHPASAPIDALGVCRGSLPLVWRWGEAKRGCELRVDAPWRWPISLGPKVFTLSSGLTGHLFQDASPGLPRRQPDSPGAAG